MKKPYEIIIFILFLFISAQGNAQHVSTEWVVNNFTGYPVGVMLVLDRNNNAVVTGQSGDHTKIITTKYDIHGNVLWERFFVIPEMAVVATWLSKDSLDNVIVTGYRHNFSSNPVESGLLTLKYDSNGNLLWDKLIAGTWAFAVRSIVDPSGNIYVTGRAWQYTATHDFVTVKYDPSGTQIWFDTFDQNSGFHTPTGMDLDQSGNLFITGGGLSGGLITVMYSSIGTRLWVREHSGSAGSSIRADNIGGVYVTGSFYNVGTSNDLMLLKYDLSGNLEWQKFLDFGNSEYGRFVNIDSHSDIFVTGYGALPGAFPGWLTVKLDPLGNLLWYKRFKSNLSWEEFPHFALIGPEDEIYVSGNVGVPFGGTTYHGLETIRYNTDGSNPWVAEINQYAGIGKGLALGTDLSLYAVGQFYYSVIKYSQSITLSLKVLIEGFYDPVSDKMTKDTARIYLRSVSAPYFVADSALGVLDSNGRGTFNFRNAVNSVPYYIVVKHRNGLETWSAGENSFISGNMIYDFTISSSRAFGNNQILKGSRYCLYSGDVERDGMINLSDVINVYNAASNFLPGYASQDCNGDFIVNLTDLIIAHNNARSFISMRRP